MAHEPDPAAKESLAALLGDLIADAKDLLVRELRLAQLEVRQNVRATARAERARHRAGCTCVGCRGRARPRRHSH